jgi:hypothetical protein
MKRTKAAEAKTQAVSPALMAGAAGVAGVAGAAAGAGAAAAGAAAGAAVCCARITPETKKENKTIAKMAIPFLERPILKNFISSSPPKP